MSKIQWTEETWNPIVGCSVVSPGCTNCYAMRDAHRLGRQSGKAGDKYRGLTKSVNGKPVWTGEMRFWEPVLDQPLRWSRPRMIFVNSMSDLFHEDVPDEWISRVFSVMEQAPRHQFQVLTKRALRMRDFLVGFSSMKPWPYSNVWLGVSAEDQRRADERIPLLLGAPAAVRFVSAEPLLGPVDLSRSLSDISIHHHPDNDQSNPAVQQLIKSVGKDFSRRHGGLHWVIAGGESGPGTRPCHANWIRDIVCQCRGAFTPVFVKQLGARPIWDRDESKLYLRDRKGGDPSEWPADLRVREMPEGTALDD